MKKNCELCKLPARTFCESDQASLCWDCDSKVHAANFLVERHMRTLLCHACQSPTPWKASGARLGNALSLCERCAAGRKLHAEANVNAGAGAEQQEESEGDNDNEDDTDYDSDEEDEDEDEEDGDNQVVPWSSTAAQPPPASSSSGSEESVTVSKCNDNHDEVVSKLVTTMSLKRRRLDHDFEVSDSKNWKNQRRKMDEDDLLGCDGEPSSKAAMRRYSDVNRTEHSQPHD